MDAILALGVAARYNGRMIAPSIRIAAGAALAVVLSCATASAQFNGALPSALCAGWQGERVCELLSEDATLGRSTLTYGIPDVISQMSNSAADQQQLCRSVAQCVRLFEPRLLNVQVQAIPSEDRYSRSVRLIIEAVLYVEPIRERVTFDTLVPRAFGSQATLQTQPERRKPKSQSR